MAGTKGKKRREDYGSGSVRQLPSGKYQARYRDPYGRRIAIGTFTNEKDARDHLAGVRRGLIEVPNDLERESAPLFADFGLEWIENRTAKGRGRGLKPSTRADYLRMYRNILMPVFGHLPLDQISPRLVNRWHGSLDKDKAVQKAHAYSLLASIMKTAVAHDYIIKTPCNIDGAGKVKAKPRGKIATVEQIEAIADHLPEHYRAMIFVAAWCGLRSGEVRALQRRDFIIDANGRATLTVERGVTRVNGEDVIGDPKSESGFRTLVVPENVTTILRQHLARFSDGIHPEALIFPARKGGIMHPNTLGKMFKDAAIKAGRPDLTFHDLRACFGTRAAHAGATPEELKRMIGDSSMSAVLRYLRAAEGRDDLIASRMNDMMRGAS